VLFQGVESRGDLRDEVKARRVLMGGFSSERPVSLSSGNACAEALEQVGYRSRESTSIAMSAQRAFADLKPDVAFNALHGPFGEDGTIQGILEYLGIPYTHSGVLASALAMNKEQAKKVAKAAGIPIAESRVHRTVSIGNQASDEAAPMWSSRCREGSSFGVVIVKEDQSHPPQVISSSEWRYGDTVMVERYVHGRELTCAVMGDVALGVCEIVPTGHAFYDYDSKYVPADQSTNSPRKFHRIFTKKYKHWRSRLIKRSGAGASPGLTSGTTTAILENGEVVWLEVNTQPGMTPTSLVPEIAAQAGHSFGELLSWMVEDASCLR
jgi:D-alanine-D-alanine ligase